MVKVRSPIYAFNGGEISRRLEGRSDLDGIYDRSTAKMFNYVATVEGPATKRPGTRYIKAAALSSTWLSRFVFNSTQAYVLEWLDQAVRFFTNGGQIEVAGVPYEVAVPYAAADAPRISSKQSFDRLYLAHSKYFPGMLTRTAAETFTYDKIPLKDGPFKDWNTDESKTITWAGVGTVGGVATISANFDLFLPGHVGAPFIFEVVGFSEIPAWEPAMKTTINDASSYITVGALVRSDGKVYKCVDLGGSKFTGTVEPTHTKGAEWDGARAAAMGQNDGVNSGVKWEYQFDRFGIGTITALVSSQEAELTVTRAFPTLDTPSWYWAHASYSDVEGYPQLVTIWGGRLIFIKGVEIAGSVVGDYFNFRPVDDDGVFSPDMAFRLSLNISDPPTWVHADKEYLLLGSHSEEIVVGQVNQAAGISADNLSAQPQSAYGSADATWPIPIGPSVIFLQRGARKIREATFSYDQGRFVAVNANVYARHITRSGISWFAWQSEPEEMLWAGRTDGTLVAHPHNPEQEIKGFSRAELAEGSAIAGVAIPSDDGSKDDLWILAELDGAPGILQLADYWDEDAGLDMADAFFVDWGVSYDGTGAGVDGADVLKQDFTTGLDHLEGKLVRILADGVEINTLTVTAGAIHLPKLALKVTIGLGYQARLQLLRAEARGVPTLQGLRKQIKRLFARLIDSQAPVILNRLGEATRMFDRPNNLPMNTPAPLVNGDSNNIAVGGGGSDYSDAPELVSDDALPSIVTLLVPTYEIEEFPQ